MKCSDFEKLHHGFDNEIQNKSQHEPCRNRTRDRVEWIHGVLLMVVEARDIAGCFSGAGLSDHRLKIDDETTSISRISKYPSVFKQVPARYDADGDQDIPIKV